MCELISCTLAHQGFLRVLEDELVGEAETRSGGQAGNFISAAKFDLEASGLHGGR